eukprot:1136389-Pelagomonas_calceolata.AAC.1
MEQPNPFAPPCYPQVQRYTDTGRLNDQGEGNDDAIQQGGLEEEVSLLTLLTPNGPAVSSCNSLASNAAHA